jgi:eukaryotic-like serine/threonine-protein kinase
LNPQLWSQAEEILRAIWASPRESRELVLTQLCGQDQELLAEVRSLLEADELANQWVPPPAAEVSPLRQFGPYRLEKMIGRGGMGAVYLAHRADGNVEHKVAVKIIGLPFEIASFQERFRQERQILATLNHPHIAHFIDGGVTVEGELYLILEFVDGVAIDEYASAGNLGEAAKLDLFEQVGSAVAYAHQNLVVHRDLKPGNILVSNDKVAKLLDFGTAKILDGRDLQGSTSAGLMTVGYASPEQLRGDPATTLSDVFSLGVLLYELLSGQKAFPGGVFARMEAEPHSPPPLPGDLGLIVRKAMAPLAAERYSSVDQLLADIRRHRNGQPVLAHPPSSAYRVGKFIRRHRLPLMAAIISLGAIIGGSIATAWQARRAEARYEQIRELGKYLVFDIHGALLNVPASTVLQKEVVQKATGFLDALSSDPSAGTALRLEIASGYQKLGDVLGNPYRASLGERDKAIETYNKALSILAPVLKAEPSHFDARYLSAQIRVQRSGTSGFGGKAKEALLALTAAVADLRQLAADRPSDSKLRLSLAKGLQLLAMRSSSGGGTTEITEAAKVETLYAEAEQLLNSIRGASTEVLFHLAQIEYGRAILWGSADPNRALLHHAKTTQWLDQLPPEQAQLLETQRLRANNLLNLGFAQGQAHAYPEAIRNLTQAQQILATWSAMEPANKSAQYQLSSAYRSRGIVHTYDKQIRPAIADFSAAAAIHQDLSTKDPTSKLYPFLRGELLVRIGNLLHESGQSMEAQKATKEGLAILTALAEPPTATFSQLAGACRWLTETSLQPLRRPQQAAAFCQRAIDMTKGTDPDGWEGLSTAKLQLGDRPGAIAAAKQAIALLPPTAPGKPISQQRASMEATLKRLQQR